MNSQRKIATELDTAVAADTDCIVSLDGDETAALTFFVVLFNQRMVVKQTASFCGNKLV